MRFETDLLLPATRADVFRFFSEAANLERLTPPWVHFHVVTPQPIEMRRGTIIDYRLRIHGVPVRWRSEITVWEPPDRFVDEQRRGPYRSWTHTHRFRDVANGTLVSDSVDYQVPLAFITGPFVRRDVEQIFAFRTRTLQELFGVAQDAHRA